MFERSKEGVSTMRIIIDRIDPNFRYVSGRPYKDNDNNEGEEMSEQNKDGVGVDPTALMNNILESQFYTGLKTALEEYDVQKNTQSGK